MKKIVLLLLPAFMLPTAVNAETWWLLVGFKQTKGRGTTSQVVTMPMQNEQECEDAGGEIISNKGLHGEVFSHARYVCVKGK